MVGGDHKCEHERDIAIVMSDMEWVKKTLSGLEPKIESMYNHSSSKDNKIDVLNNEVFGKDGKKSIREELNVLRLKFATWSGGLAVLVTIINVVLFFIKPG